MSGHFARIEIGAAPSPLRPEESPGRITAAVLRERRMLTLLSHDPAGFTRFSEGKDTEHVGKPVDALLVRLRGTLAGLTGGLLRHHGAPVTMERDATCLVGCGTVCSEARTRAALPSSEKAT